MIGIDVGFRSRNGLTLVARLYVVPHFRMSQQTVLVTGVFDLLHAGHLKLLNWAATLGTLTVAIDDESTVPALGKGDNRPFLSNEERVATLSELGCVARVFVFRGPGATEAIKATNPDIWVKGGDYSYGGLLQAERDAIRSGGGQVRFAPQFDAPSTTDIVARITGHSSGQ